MIDKELLERFCSDFRNKSEIEILEFGSEKMKEIYAIAKKRGIDLDENKDLAGIKMKYAFTDVANKNGAILPKEVVEEKISTLIGKPLNIDHIIKYVIGYIIDAYLEGSTIYVLGILFRGNFREEWRELKSLFEKGKLTCSFELYAFDKEYNPDGTFKVKDFVFAGGGILFRKRPAFPDAKVLEVAKSRFEEPAYSTLGEELIVASEDLEVVNSQGETDYIVKREVTSIENLIYLYNKEGLITNVEKSVKRKSIDYFKSGKKIEYTSKEELEEITKRIKAELEKSGFVCTCVECGYEKILEEGEHCKDFKCPKCGGQMRRKERPSRGKSSLEKGGNSMKEFVEKLLAFFDILPVLEDKEFASDEEFEQFEENFVSLVEGEELIDEKGEKLEAKKLTYQERKKLSDDDFAVVIEVKKKKGEGTRKIRMFPIHDEAHVRNALARLGQTKVKQTLKRLGVSIEKVREKILKRAKKLNMTELLKRYEKAEIDVYKVLEEAGLKVEKEKELAEAIKESLEKTKEELKSSIEAEIKTSYEKEKASKEEEISKLKAEVEFYKSNAKKIVERREELKEFAEDLSDEDLLDDVKYENAKLKKELASLKKDDLNDGKNSKRMKASTDDNDITKELRKAIRNKIK